MLGMAPCNATPTSSSHGNPPPGLPLTQVQARPAKNAESCSAQNCTRLCNCLCSLKMCKKCCTSQPAVCIVTSHNTTKQLPQFTFNLPSEITPLPTDRGWDALSILIDEDPTIWLFRAEEEQRNAANRQRQIEEERERAEDEALAVAIAASVETLPLSTPSLSMTVSSNSVVLTPPTSSPSPLPMPVISQLRACTPPLPTKSSKTQKQLPTITNHLDSNWRQVYDDRSKEPRTHKGKAQGDSAIIQKFFIMFWAEVCHQYSW